MKFSLDKIENAVVKALVQHGLPEEQAEVLANSFVTASACGVDTHGVSMLPAYIKKLDAQEYNTAPQLNVEKQTGAFAVVDGDNSIGAYSGAFCMDMAVENAKKQGIYTVFAKHCNTYGPAFYYTRLASQQGLIGVTFCNTPTAMAAWNGKTKLFGTNPFAISVPSRSKGTILFDMATSKVAKSKINKARLAGEQIPNDWAIDVEGNPTTDPLEAIKGMVLPMAEYKGYGLAMSIDIVAGLLSGAGYMNGVNRFYSDDGGCMNVGQVFIAIDPRIIMDDSFYDDMDGYIDAIHNSESIDGKPVIFPGENKQNRLNVSMTEGIELNENVYGLIKEYIDEQ